MPGPILFARFAYPPNALGYCGPADHRAVLEHAATGSADRELYELAAGFAGAWPYLQLIAGSAGVADPLDADVVEAYWIGNRLLGRCEPRWLAASVDERFALRLGTDRETVTSLAAMGGVPHHSFHVICVSPWVGLLRAGFTDAPLTTMDQCRIRTGFVLTADDAAATVATDRLAWDGERLSVQHGAVEVVHASAAGYDLAGPIAIGDRVAIHWGWICDRLDAHRAGRLAEFTARSLRAVNASARPKLAGAVASSA